MKPLTLVAVIKTKPEHAGVVFESLKQIVEPTRAEAGCINYDLHRSLEDPTVFVFYENWETRAHWEAHDQSEHLKQHRERTAGMTEDVTLYHLEGA